MRGEIVGVVLCYIESSIKKFCFVFEMLSPSVFLGDFIETQLAFLFICF